MCNGSCSRNAQPYSHGNASYPAMAMAPAHVYAGGVGCGCIKKPALPPCATVYPYNCPIAASAPSVAVVETTVVATNNGNYVYRNY